MSSGARIGLPITASTAAAGAARWPVGMGTWTPAVGTFASRKPAVDGATAVRVVGVLPGEGIGPDVVAAALDVLDAVAQATGHRFEVVHGGAIGKDAERASGQPLTDEVVDFCRAIFARDGAVLHGPGGGRFVYDLRRRFDLFCKLAPNVRWAEIEGSGPLRDGVTADADVLVVRDNSGGLYQGEFATTVDGNGQRHAQLHATYSEAQARRIIRVGARLAATRRGLLTVVVKDGGVPSMTDLWRSVAVEEAQGAAVSLDVLNVDHVAYRMVAAPATFDVVVAPNMFGDVIADLGGLVVGGRGLTYSGNFSADGAAVYQTSHGAAYDLAGKDVANPVGQILSLAMLLAESFGLVDPARLVVRAVCAVVASGIRTVDLQPARQIVGTRAFGQRVVEQIALLGAPSAIASASVAGVDARSPSAARSR